MCGIFGIIACQQGLNNNDTKNIYKVIIDGLKQLQNRGYDSSGMCVLNNKKNRFDIHKYASTNEMSSIDKLCNLDLDLDLNVVVENQCNVGIGHNRWATHGAKNDINSHPHISNDQQFVLVHNGIIENYMELKKMLIGNGYHFYSQTDTEVIVNLISYYYKELDDVKDVKKSIQKTISVLEGTYGIVVLHVNNPNQIYCVRNGSPILIGKTDEYAIITSEQSGFCNLVNNYITLNNDDICVISYDKCRDGVIKMTTENQYIHKNVTSLNNDLTPEPYSHWLIKEIYEQPNVVLKSMNYGGRIKNHSEVKLGGLEAHFDTLSNIDNIILLGCGTSYNAALYGMNYLKHICKFNTVQVFDGAEFNLLDIPRNGTTVLVLISQSGETKDLHRCIQLAKENNLLTIGIVNVVDSLIAREVDCGIYCNAGREMSVASTKAFTSQVVCLSLLSIWFAQIHGVNENKRIQMIKDLRNLENDFKNTIESLNDVVKTMCQDEKFILNKTNNLFLLGKGVDECVSREGSLKIKEVSYIHSESYSASALKHGPFALLDKNFPVIIFNLHEEHRAKILNCYEEIRSRHSPIFFITNDDTIDIDVQDYSNSTFVIRIKKNHSYSSLLGIVPIQLMAYYLSIYRNINPDIPKNLAKVVTVD